MKTMNDYTCRCTEEQTRRALKLGAPISILTYTTCNKQVKICDVIDDVFLIYNDSGILRGDSNVFNALEIPTTQQMIGWLRKKGVKCFVDQRNNLNIAVVVLYNNYEKGDEVILNNFENGMTYKEAELAAIDAALEYLERSIT